MRTERYLISELNMIFIFSIFELINVTVFIFNIVFDNDFLFVLILIACTWFLDNSGSEGV